MTPRCTMNDNEKNEEHLQMENINSIKACQRAHFEIFHRCIKQVKPLTSYRFKLLATHPITINKLHSSGMNWLNETFFIYFKFIMLCHESTFHPCLFVKYNIMVKLYIFILLFSAVQIDTWLSSLYIAPIVWP